ncbi:MAG: hypothetical protein ORN29_02255 [Rhodoferax sp.]|nr:hypothetical protein [Rhodoferax sp.]
MHSGSNSIIGQLSNASHARLSPHMERVVLMSGAVVSGSGAHAAFYYFPLDAALMLSLNLRVGSHPRSAARPATTVQRVSGMYPPFLIESSSTPGTNLATVIAPTVCYRIPSQRLNAELLISPELAWLMIINIQQSLSWSDGSPGPNNRDLLESEIAKIVKFSIAHGYHDGEGEVEDYQAISNKDIANAALDLITWEMENLPLPATPLGRYTLISIAIQEEYGEKISLKQFNNSDFFSNSGLRKSISILRSKGLVAAARKKGDKRTKELVVAPELSSLCSSYMNKLREMFHAL